ncbi:MAG: hypothetical protein ACI37Z_03390 [Candidatus Gastranaerophilaceae bacterium]
MRKIKRFKNIAALILSVLMLLGCDKVMAYTEAPIENESVITQAQEISAQPYYVNISSIAGNIYISGVKVYLNTTVVAKNSNSNIAVTQYLERKDGSSYTIVDYWSDSCTGSILEMNNSRLCNVLKEYRLRAVVTVGTEKTTIYRYL